MLWRCPVLVGGFLLIEREVFERLEPFRQRGSSAGEAGGIVLGYRRGLHLHVIDATTPGPQDVRMRNGFHRRDPSHEHIALARAAEERGELVLAGALANPPDGSVLLFRGSSPAAAEAFAQNDPYVKNGLVTRWRVREWTTVVGRDAEVSLPPSL